MSYHYIFSHKYYYEKIKRIINIEHCMHISSIKEPNICCFIRTSLSPTDFKRLEEKSGRGLSSHQRSPYLYFMNNLSEILANFYHLDFPFASKNKVTLIKIIGGNLNLASHIAHRQNWGY